ncbi:MAG: peptidoglycan-binding domain-containing protein [Putridiphycobacter sp.]
MEKKTKYLLLGLGVVTVGTGTFFYLQHQKKKKQQANNRLTASFEQVEDFPTLPTLPSGSSGSSSSTKSGFPLKKGSQGSLVLSLQKALIKKYGANILPQYGADGHFGAETVQALQSKGLPTTISSTIYNQFVVGAKSSPPSSSSISNALHQAIIGNRFSSALVALKQIQSVAQYSTVNQLFKQTRVGLVRKTIVTALLDRFYTSSQKKQLNSEFYQIGLKYNGNQWGLSGLFGLAVDQLVTIEPTQIWDESGKKIKVPTATILGEYLDANDGVTEFETLDRKRLFVKTTSIRYAS